MNVFKKSLLVGMTQLWTHQKIKDTAASGFVTRMLAAPSWISYNKVTAAGSPGYA